MLLARGADPYARNLDGEPCSHFAAIHLSVADLRKFVALAPRTVALEDDDGRTALHLAIEQHLDADEIVRVLLEAGKYFEEVLFLSSFADVGQVRTRTRRTALGTLLFTSRLKTDPIRYSSCS